MVVWFPVERQALSLDFANTTYLRHGLLTDGLAEPGGLADWVNAVDAPHVPATATPVFIELRDAIRGIFRASVDGVAGPAAARRIVNQTTKAAPGWLELQQDLTAARTRRAEDPATNLRAQLATDTIMVVTGPRHGLLRACPAEGCQGFFLQQHPRRGFCSPSCANRTRVARHYHRHHDADSRP